MKGDRYRFSPEEGQTIEKTVQALGADILSSPVMQREREFPHHGRISCYDHSLAVARLSLDLAQRLRVKMDARSLVRGALLHDLYLYDWHIPDEHQPHRLHGFFHPSRALKNAQAHFSVNSIERNIIIRHMFPLTVIPPVCRESWVVCLADTVCAVREWLISH